jgi:hypothetical protein
MRSLFIMLFLIPALYCTGQDCTAAALLKRPGVWKAGMSGSITGVSAKDLLREKATVAGIHKMITGSYTPVGCQALFTNNFSGENPGAGKNWISDFYGYSIYVLPYLCDPASSDKTKSYTAIATATIARVDVNVLGALNNLYAAELPDDDFRGYLKIASRPVIKDGYYLLSDRITDNTDPKKPTRETSWLITYNDTLPFYYVSRKEYLQLTKKRLEKTMKDDASSKDYYAQFMNAINREMAKPEADLAKAAICMGNDEERFTGFVEEGTRGSFIAVKPNPAYYHKQLSRSVPQFIVATFSVTEGEPVMTINMDGIKKAMNFSMLKSMLGKETAVSPRQKPVKK